MRILILGLLGFAGFAPRAESGPRLHENFNQNRRFARQMNGSAALGSFDRNTSEAARIEPRFQDAPQAAYDDAGWQPVNLPHTWNVHDVMDEAPGYWRGIGWYRKHFSLGEKLAGKRIFSGV